MNLDFMTFKIIFAHFKPNNKLCRAKLGDSEWKGHTTQKGNLACQTLTEIAVIFACTIHLVARKGPLR